MKISGKTLALVVAFTCFAGFGTIVPSYALGNPGSEAGPHSNSFQKDNDERDRDRDNDKDRHKPKKRCEDKDRDDKNRDKDRDRNRERDDDDDCTCSVTSPAVLSAKAPGVSVPNPATLLSAVSIVNSGKTAAKDVRVTSIKLKGETLTFPASLPVDLGNILAKNSAIVNADFSGGPFNPGNSYLLSVQGTYSVKNKTHCFSSNVTLVVPPAAPGSAPVKTTTVGSKTVSGGKFPPRTPSFGDEVNTSRWTVPTGPFVPGTPTPSGTATQKAPIGDPPAIDFVTNNSLGVGGGSPAEPSGGATGGGVVFVSANWLAAYSKDGGATFTSLNPTTIFPNDAVGFCCDQIVQYVPSIDRFIWLLQGNGVRIASASPADIINSGGTAWTYWNLTPSVFGENGGFDYPDLSVGNNYLYMSWNAGGSNWGHQVARTSLAGLQAGGTIEIDFTNPADSRMAWFAHLVQDPSDEIFWAGHNNNSQMRIFSLKEGSNTYFWQDIGISSWSTSGISSTTPDGQDWLSEVHAVGTWIAGGTRTGNQVWFAWTAGTDSNFQQPHVEMVTLNIDNNNPPNINLNQQVQIWNNSYAFAYPALATNGCTGEVGLSLEYGGNGNYENHVVGFWGDFLVYITTGSSAGTSRFGDYVTLRQHPPTDGNPGNLFDAFGYGINNPGAQTDIHYVLFGRPASACNPLK